MGLNRSALSTITELLGISLLVIGAGMVSIPVAFIVAGTLLTLLGAAIGGGKQ